MPSADQNCACQAAPRLIFACSGASDVGALTDQAARSLSRHKAGKMYCLAGIGGRVADIMENSKEAEKILVLDGCDSDCAWQTLIHGGFKDFLHLRLSSLGMKKGETPVAAESIKKVEEKAREMLG